MLQYQQFLDALLRCNDLLITAHHDPDADCIGSMLGLYHLCGGKERGWIMALEDDIPLNLRYLPGWELIVRPADISTQPTAVLLVDCGEQCRVSRSWLETYSNLPFYCLDHHVSNEFKGELALVEPYASSSGEIVAALAEATGLTLDCEAATCLYSAIVSDTGCFRYENTTPRSLAMAAKLLEQGVNMEQVRVKLFESRSSAGMAVLQTAFRNMQFTADNKLCYSFVRYEEAQAVQAVMADFHNIANYTLLKSGVKIGLFFEECSDYVKVSLRSRQGLRMDKLAQALGGGGHMRASGCLINGSLEIALQQVLEKALEMLADDDR